MNFNNTNVIIIVIHRETSIKLHLYDLMMRSEGLNNASECKTRNLKRMSYISKI